MQGLTKRQEKVLDYISSSIVDRGYPPTLREIGQHMGIKSTNGVNDHLRALERKGYLTREDMKSRALRPVVPEDGAGTTGQIRIPVIGNIAPGQPILSDENIENYVTMDRFFLGNIKEAFGMWVTGDAMDSAGIRNGDFICVKKQMFAENGDIVVALVGDTPAVRYYHPEKDLIRFVPANANHGTIIVNRQDFLPMQLLGVVTGLTRRL